MEKKKSQMRSEELVCEEPANEGERGIKEETKRNGKTKEGERILEY